MPVINDLAEVRRVARLLQLTAELSHAGTWHMVLASGRIFWSEETCRLHGMPHGMAPTLAEAGRFYAPESRSKFIRLVKECARSDAAFDERLQVITASGQVAWVRCIGEAVRNPDGEIVALHGVYQDLSREKPPAAEEEGTPLPADDAERIADMRANEARFIIVSRLTTDAIYDLDMESGKLWRSDNMIKLFGYSPEDQDSGIQAWLARVHPDDRMRVVQSAERAVASETEGWTEEYRFQRTDGSYAKVLDRAVIVRDANGRAIRTIGAMVDLTERKQAEHKQRLADARIREQASLLDKAKDAIVIMDLDFRVSFWNRRAERLYGWTAEEIVGRSLAEMLYDDPAGLHEAKREVLDAGEWSAEIVERHKDGTPLQVEINWTLVSDEDGAPKTIFAIKSDISRRKLAERRIRQLAFYDTLTGLPNRRMLMDQLQASLSNGKFGDCMGAVLFIDLDNFKTLNDTFGHACGDMLLQQVASRLCTCVRSGDTVARLGGDEFVIVLENLDAALETARQQAGMVADKILLALNQPFQLGDHDHYATPSVGIALVDDKQDEVGELLKRADLAMYQAKAAGRNTVRFFNPDMQAAVAARAGLEFDIRQGLRENQFVLHYQPQVDRHGQLVGVEALVRWWHPRRGMVTPADFVPLAEETGLILHLGQWALESACLQLAGWRQYPGLDKIDMSVNVSARQFHHPDFVQQVMSTLGHAGVDPRRIKLELTESLLVENLDDTIAKMRALKARGVGFCLDDFGTGYSSLTYLKRLPLDILKIDGSFVRDLLSEPHNAVIAKAVIALGSSLGLKVIAEGVESETQRDFLSQQGCRVYQGYLYSAPLGPEQVPGFADACQQRSRHRRPPAGGAPVR